LYYSPDDERRSTTMRRRPGQSMVIDCHAHLRHRSSPTWKEDDRKLIEAADKLGIDQLCCSILTPRRPSTAEGFRECSQWVAEAMVRFPGRVLGYCYVNPGYHRESLEEIRRCIEDRGFMGIKLYNAYTCNEPVLWPLVELAIELGVPILQHAGHSHYFNSKQPRISDGGHLADHLRTRRRRRGLGMDDQGAAKRPGSIPRHQRQRDRRRHHRDGGRCARYPAAAVWLRHVHDCRGGQDPRGFA